MQGFLLPGSSFSLSSIQGVQTEVSTVILLTLIELNRLVEMDDGNRGLFPAWRVQHDSRDKY